MKSKVNGVVRAVLGACVLALALPLVSCGGTSEREETFVASRVIAFGDETSVITETHKKYTVNGLAAGSTTEVDCGVNPIWIQFVAGHYGMVFPECDGLGTNPVSRIRATAGATVAALARQIDQQISLYGGFKAGDLVTVLVGVNDIVALYSQNPPLSQNDLSAGAESAGLQLAAQVNRLANLGAKVLISTIPDMGLTPYAGSPNGNPAVLTNMSTAFNNALLARMNNDGYNIGLIQLDEYLVSLNNARIQGTGTYANTTMASCIVALPNCTTLTQVPNAQVVAWLWADDVHIGPAAQAGLGSLAVSRVQTNPF